MQEYWTPILCSNGQVWVFTKKWNKSRNDWKYTGKVSTHSAEIMVFLCRKLEVYISAINKGEFVSKKTLVYMYDLCQEYYIICRNPDRVFPNILPASINSWTATAIIIYSMSRYSKVLFQYVCMRVRLCCFLKRLLRTEIRHLTENYLHAWSYSPHR